MDRQLEELIERLLQLDDIAAKNIPEECMLRTDRATGVKMMGRIIKLVNDDQGAHLSMETCSTGREIKLNARFDPMLTGSGKLRMQFLQYIEDCMAWHRNVKVVYSQPRNASKGVMPNRVLQLITEAFPTLESITTEVAFVKPMTPYGMLTAVTFRQIQTYLEQGQRHATPYALTPQLL